MVSFEFIIGKKGLKSNIFLYQTVKDAKEINNSSKLQGSNYLRVGIQDGNVQIVENGKFVLTNKKVLNGQKEDDTIVLKHYQLENKISIIQNKNLLQTIQLPDSFKSIAFCPTVECWLGGQISIKDFSKFNRENLLKESTNNNNQKALIEDLRKELTSKAIELDDLKVNLKTLQSQKLYSDKKAHELWIQNQKLLSELSLVTKQKENIIKN